MGLRASVPYTGPTVPGIDVSAYQPYVDWPAVAGAGKRFAISRLGDGLHLDHAFEGHYKGARDAGIVPGAYQFMRPSLDITAQAKLAVGALKPLYRHGDVPIALDVERGGDAHPSVIADRMLLWIAIVESALGVVPVIYAGSFFAQAVHDSRLSVFPLWTPDYADTTTTRIPRQWSTWTLRQTSGSGTCPGIHGACDLDVYRGDERAFDSWRNGIAPR